MSNYIINILIFLSGYTFYAQDSIPKIDSLLVKQKYGIRVGIDISRPIIQTIQKKDLGFEIVGDIRVAKNWYVATELGFASEPGKEDYIQFHTKGTYAKLGFNYNTYENWIGMNNEVYIGLRYGFSTFQQHLISYTTPDINNYFGYNTYEPNTIYNGLSAHWGEMHVGLKVEVLKNFFLASGIHFKKLFYDKKPENFENLYIPGFNKVLFHNNGIGFNYTLSYLVPVYKK